MNKLVLVSLISCMAASCAVDKKIDVDKELAYCDAQIRKALPNMTDPGRGARNIAADASDPQWHCSDINDWTCGFWPGILWYDYEFTKDEEIKRQAERFSEAIIPILDNKNHSHDLGFMFFCSLGQGYRLTQNPEYKKQLLRAADSLALLYNPVVGTINSWPGMCKTKSWPHNTIIDNMINLELLFWAAKNGGSQRLYDIAKRHAEVTMENQFRDDYSTYHVVVYDTISGNRLARVTHQGYADESMWARGQAWAVYGFAMAFRETGEKAFLQTACKAADRLLENIPEDYVPYWDYSDPDIPNAPRDASAASVTASGLIELSQLVDDAQLSEYYLGIAQKMLISLSSEKYQSRDKNVAFLLHSTGHYPDGSEIDASIVYADYYYIEALHRLKML
ncbi:MAG: glycoside hydrolase family 88 protein [Alistipes sp.]|nr:glycoside hydrolase family 88 protein [Alistipes sp.]